MAAALLGLLLVTGCSEGEAERAGERAVDEARESIDLPDVNWDKYGNKLKDRLDRLADEADCAELKKALAKAEKNDTEITEYVKAKMREADC